jgi:hypothetical protein
LKIAYLDIFAGASGDMLLGALLDAGLSLDELRSALSKLPLSGYHISARRAQRGLLSGTQVCVAIQGEEQPRSLSQILSIIAASELPQQVKEQGTCIFHRLAQAEAKVHGTTVEDVHLHEVGATDAIVDVMGVVLGLHLLGVEAVFASPFPLGSGFVECSHGTLPLPAPATLELLTMSGAPTRHSPEAVETVTPTAAAIITTLASFERPAFTLERVGYGVGSHEFATVPNMLRLWLGERAEPALSDILLLETNIDDMSPELCGYVMERLFEQGALDVWFVPIQMKKNRPAVMLCALAPVGAEGALVETILRETPTLGIRVQAAHRYEAGRELVEVDTPLGRARVKLKRLHGSLLAATPEYEDCRRLAREHKLPFQEVYRIVSQAADVLSCSPGQTPI